MNFLSSLQGIEDHPANGTTTIEPPGGKKGIQATGRAEIKSRDKRARDKGRNEKGWEEGREIGIESTGQRQGRNK